MILATALQSVPWPTRAHLNAQELIYAATALRAEARRAERQTTEPAYQLSRAMLQSAARTNDALAGKLKRISGAAQSRAFWMPPLPGSMLRSGRGEGSHMRARIALFGIFILGWHIATAGVVCTRAPYGASIATYGRFEFLFGIGAALGSKGDTTLTESLFRLDNLEMQRACLAKFYSKDLGRYRKLGITAKDIASHSTPWIATVAISHTTQRDEAQTDYSPPALTTVSVPQFEIAGPKFAAEGTKVVISGAYIRKGNVGYLYENSNAIEMTMGQGNTVYEPHIALLTDSALEEARARFLACSEDPAASQIGCSVTIIGTATNCNETSAFGAAREVPCIDVHSAAPQ